MSLTVSHGHTRGHFSTEDDHKKWSKSYFINDALSAIWGSLTQASHKVHLELKEVMVRFSL